MLVGTSQGEPFLHAEQPVQYIASPTSANLLYQADQCSETQHAVSKISITSSYEVPGRTLNMHSWNVMLNDGDVPKECAKTWEYVYTVLIPAGGQKGGSTWSKH